MLQLIRRPSRLFLGLLIAIGGLGAGTSARAASPAQVDAAIEKAKAFLYSRMKGDNFESVPKPDEKDGPASITGKQWGGQTAIATYALLAAGEKPTNPKLAPAIEWLKKAEMGGHYAVGMRAQVWTFLNEKDAKSSSVTDYKILLNALGMEAANKGTYSYFTDLKTMKPQPTWWDHSVSQYGVLGVWACEQAGQEVPSEYWKIVDARWRADQMGDGGWSYKNDGKARGTMTAAGIATLFITQDYLLLGRRWEPCTGGKRDEAIEKGLAWMDKNINEMLSGGAHHYYGLYGVERIGVASGRKFFGTVDWYKVGADDLVKKQTANGSWGSIPDTCFSLIFLVRGRAPVIMNKLEYDVAADPTKPGAKPQEEPWNGRPRDVANFAHWSSKQIEQYLNWQVVNLKVKADDLHDAPILYIAGSEALNFKDEEIKKLREFVADGGMILGNADCGSKAFGKSFTELGNKLFPKYEFRDLPATHTIYTDEQYRPAKWRVKPKVLAQSNGVRELMILIPDADLSRAWQTRAEKTRDESFQLMQNIFLYAVDKANLMHKGDTYIVNVNPSIKADRDVKVARIMAGDNPDPEPSGWQRLRAILNTRTKVDVQLERVKLGENKLKDAKVAHLTGTTKVILKPEQRDELKQFVSGGGTLVIDAAGGSADFADSIEAELAQTFGGTASNFGTILPLDDALYTKGHKIEKITWRNYVKGKLSGKMSEPRVRGLTVGSGKVYYSREDLTAGLVGQPVDGILGYSPESATAIMGNVVLSVAGKPSAVADADKDDKPPAKPAAAPKKPAKPAAKK